MNIRVNLKSLSSMFSWEIARTITIDNTGITVLLSLCVFLLMVSEQMPATSETIPLIGEYCQRFIYSLLITSTITYLFIIS